MAKVKRWIVVVIWLGLIFYLSSQPATESLELSRNLEKLIVALKEMVVPDLTIEIHRFQNILRKAAHFFVFMVLAFLVMYALDYSNIQTLKRKMAITFGASVIFAILDETYQYFVPGRGAQVSDVFLDSVGAMVGIGLWLLFEKWRQRRSAHRDK
ncbi:MAG: VanZ family protein [Bacillota bacterium]|nr:VanZ family protein [Bacillota bacterium]MDW7676578.1 VanZ family protein [Bacillota bacterium]